MIRPLDLELAPGLEVSAALEIAQEILNRTKERRIMSLSVKLANRRLWFDDWAEEKPNRTLYTGR